MRKIFLMILCMLLVTKAEVVFANSTNNTVTAPNLQQLPGIYGGVVNIGENDQINATVMQQNPNRTYRYEVGKDSDVLLNLAITSYMDNAQVVIYKNLTDKILDERITKDANSVSKTLERTLCLGNGKYYIWFITDGKNTGSLTISTQTQKIHNQDVGRGELLNPIVLRNAFSIPINGSYIGALNVSEASDLYQMTIPKSGVVTFRFDYYFKDCILHILDKKGTEIWRKQLTWNENLKAGAYVDQIAFESGVYYWEISRPSGNNKIESSGKYKIELNYEYALDNETEPNQDSRSAETIILGGRNDALLTLGDGVDTYKVSIPQKQYVTFYAKTKIEDYEWILYNNEYEEIKRQTFRINATAAETKEDLLKREENKMALTYELPAGTYYFQIKSKLSGAYSVAVKPTDLPDETVIWKKQIFKTQDGLYEIKVWRKYVKGVNGYEFYVADNANYDNVKVYDTSEKMVKWPVNKGQTFYVKVRTYKDIGNGERIYSKFSLNKAYRIK